ncbi:MAG: PspA/IM30 family protein [Myxococcota bacterium]
MDQREGFFARFGRLVRGIFGMRMSRAEARNAEAVYHNTIRGQRDHHDKLKQALGRLIYLRNKTEAVLDKEKDNLDLVERALREAAVNDDDKRALLLIDKKRRLQEIVERLESDLARFSEQSREAKGALGEIELSITRLKNERDEMLARKAHALARRDIQATLDNAMSPHSVNMQALENVRESIAMLESQAGLSTELRGDQEDVSMESLRRDDAKRRDQEALQALKMELKGRMLPEHDANLAVAQEQDEIVLPREQEQVAV